MMTLKFDGDFYDLSWADLREAIEQDEAFCCQLLADRGNVNELRRELKTERPDLVECLDTIADDWTTIRWRLASIVLLERVSNLDNFCKVAQGAMADDIKAIKRLIEMLKGVDEAECAHWENILIPTEMVSPIGSTPPISVVEVKPLTLVITFCGIDSIMGHSNQAMRTFRALWKLKCAYDHETYEDGAKIYFDGKDVADIDINETKEIKITTVNGVHKISIVGANVFSPVRGCTQISPRFVFNETIDVPACNEFKIQLKADKIQHYGNGVDCGPWDEIKIARECSITH